MNFRDHTSYSRLALEAQDYAASHGGIDAFHHAMFDAYWRDSRDIGDVDVVLEVAGSVGLDPGELRPILEKRTLQAQVEAQLDEARSLNIMAVPSFVFDERYLVQGAQPYETFQRVMEEYVLRPREEGEG